MNPLSLHLVAEFVQCEVDFLNNLNELRAILTLCINSCSGFSLQKIDSFLFEPIGITVFAIIGESHIALHTYPEENHVSLDIFTCSLESNDSERLLTLLKLQLKPQKIKKETIMRGKQIDFQSRSAITAFSNTSFSIRYDIEEYVLSTQSKYQKIDIIKHQNFGHMLFLDYELQIAEADVDLYTKALLNPLVDGLHFPGNVALLGGGDGSVLRQLLEYQPENISLVEIDEVIIRASQKYLKPLCQNAFEDKRVHVSLMDATHFLEENSCFDTIIYDLTLYPLTTGETNHQDLLDQIFCRISQSLNKGGYLLFQGCSIYEQSRRQLLQSLLNRYFEKVEFQEVFIPSFCQPWIFGHAFNI